MYFHIGSNTVIQLENVIAIIDYDQQGEIKEGSLLETDHREIEYLSEDAHKSVIITNDIIYISPISSITLQKRAQGNTNGFE